MSTEGLIGDEPIVTCGSTPASAPGSPKTRVKFLCSYGGKILPRPADSHLKYVGGETRVISVPIDINFKDLLKKLTYLIDGEMVLKYQLIPEELDALISVKSDEDLKHMFEECNRCENAGAPRLRAFLFPAKPLLVDINGSVDPHHSLEQRFIEAINGIVRTPPRRPQGIISSNLGPMAVPSASACSSPRSPDSDGLNQESLLPNNSQIGRVHKVHSSPSLCSLDGQHLGGSSSPKNHLNIHQYYLNPRQQLNHSFQVNKPPIDPHRGSIPERLISVRSVGRADGVRYQVDPGPQYYYPPSRQSRGGGGCTKCFHHEDYGAHMERRRPGSHPMSPVQLSPRAYIATRLWDSPVVGDNLT